MQEISLPYLETLMRRPQKDSLIHRLYAPLLIRLEVRPPPFFLSPIEDNKGPFILAVAIQIQRLDSNTLDLADLGNIPPFPQLLTTPSRGLAPSWTLPI